MEGEKKNDACAKIVRNYGRVVMLSPVSNSEIFGELSITKKKTRLMMLVEI